MAKIIREKFENGVLVSREIEDSGVNALKVAKFCVQLVIALGVTVIAVQSVRDGSAYATLLDQAGMADGACASPRLSS